MDEREREKIIEAQRKEISLLKEIIAALTSEIQELKARINKNSKNSGNPPSSDDYSKPVVKNSRERSGRPSGPCWPCQSTYGGAG
jgi:transposase